MLTKDIDDDAPLDQNVEHLATRVVEDYKKMFPDEYRTYVGEQEHRRSMLDDQWAEVKGTDTIQRQLGEMPETLYIMFRARLGLQNFKWLMSKDGYPWFYRKFPEFITTKKI